MYMYSIQLHLTLAHFPYSDSIAVSHFAYYAPKVCTLLVNKKCILLSV